MCKGERFITDTTYILTREGCLYLVSVTDLFNRQVVGWAMGEQHDAELRRWRWTWRVRLLVGLTVHSNCDSEFANAKFHRRAGASRIHPPE